MGNLTHVQDDAQAMMFNAGTRIDPSGDYVYDALYRLVEATGREHLGIVAGAASPTDWDDAARVNPADRSALGRYRERYAYDAAGNLTELSHRSDTDPARASWARTFTCRSPRPSERRSER